MSRKEILGEVMKILKRYESDENHSGPLTESTSLAQDLDIDSARMVDIVLDVEAKFDVTIDDSKFTEIRTVKDVVDLVDGMVLQKGS